MQGMLKSISFKFFAVAALVLAFATVGRSAGQKDLQSSFPSRFGRWTATTSVIKVKPGEQDFSLLTEAGLQDWLAREYFDGSQTVSVNLRQFRDPSGAYQAYTAALDPEMQPSTVRDLSGIGHGRLLMLIGNVLVQVNTPEIPSTGDLQELARLVGKFADGTPLPPVRTYLADGFADGTQRYVLGPVGFQAALDSLHQSGYSVLTPEVGFQSGAEAMLAEYRRGKDSAALVLILYPTPQLAEQHLRHLDSVLPAAAKKAGAKIERNASLLSLVLAPTSAEYAENVRSAINYATQVTWHEPTYKITDPPLTTTIAKIILATFLLMVIAVVLGAAFGGVRLLTKIFFPGKVFDRPDQLDVLQLGLSSKRIDSRDFY
jgi:hypothetical protein